MDEKSSSSSKNVYRIDELFPKIDNLEWFPENVLLSIFAAVDDLDLLHLSQISNRFGEITQDVFKERYADKNFHVVGEEVKEEYQNLFRCFGSHITAIHFKKLKRLDENHWMIQLMNEHTKRLSKCYFSECEFNSLLNTLSQQLNLSVLILDRVSIVGDSKLPEFRHLKNFGVGVYGVNFPKLEYNRIILNNRQLETLGLVFGNVEYDVLAHVGPNLRELNVLNWNQPLQELIPISTDMEQRLEKLQLLIDSHSVDALEHISSKCKNIRELIIFIANWNRNNNLVNAIRSFASITSFNIKLERINEQLVGAIIGGLPNLITLFIELYYPPTTNEYLLDLLSECKSVETISITIRGTESEIYDGDLNARFHEKFLDIVRNRSKKVKIELRDNMEVIKTITKEGIIHRNKLVHWFKWQPEHNHSKVNLLDLTIPIDSTNEKRKQKPIEVIFDYMDVNSLYAFHHAAPDCKRLVENYMRKRYQEEGRMFIATSNETKLSAIQKFGQYVTNLNVTVCDFGGGSSFWKAINIHCSMVTTLKVHHLSSDKYTYKSITNDLFYFPYVRRFEYSANNTDTIDFDISRLFVRQSLISLKIKSNVELINNFSPHNEFANLVNIEFHTRNRSIDDFLNSMDGSVQRQISFENTAND